MSRQSGSRTAAAAAARRRRPPGCLEEKNCQRASYEARLAPAWPCMAGRGAGQPHLDATCQDELLDSVGGWGLLRAGMHSWQHAAPPCCPRHIPKPRNPPLPPPPARPHPARAAPPGCGGSPPRPARGTPPVPPPPSSCTHPRCTQGRRCTSQPRLLLQLRGAGRRQDARRRRQAGPRYLRLLNAARIFSSSARRCACISAHMRCAYSSAVSYSSACQSPPPNAPHSSSTSPPDSSPASRCCSRPSQPARQPGHRAGMQTRSGCALDRGGAPIRPAAPSLPSLHHGTTRPCSRTTLHRPAPATPNRSGPARGCAAAGPRPAAPPAAPAPRADTTAGGQRQRHSRLRCECHHPATRRHTHPCLPNTGLQHAGAGPAAWEAGTCWGSLPAGLQPHPVARSASPWAI